ncbi:hypothetical protein C8Q79DRAFT_920710 [Trametes meyenii]|nr:hypothetical protein C8Q79DRAFT_920710 [Trametes meyenii]
MSYADRIPLELWHLILQSIPRDDQRNCLHVSRTLHSIAQAILFARVTITFGLWRVQGPTTGTDEDDPDDAHELERHETISWQILRHITKDPEFAGVIKKLYVRSYAAGYAVFQLRHLEEALLRLPNLSSFVWDGDLPRFHSKMLESLAKGSGSVLTELRVSISSLSTAHAAHFSKLQKLRSVVLNLGFIDNPPSAFAVAGVRACLTLSPSTLRALHVAGDAIWNIPMRSFVNLQELVLQDPETLNALGLVLRHCAQLTSFALVVSSLFAPRQLYRVFEENADAVPELTSFKLIMYGDCFMQHTEELLRFLRGKKWLRRLDVELNLDSADEGEYTQWYELLSEFPKLEVLGMGICGHTFTTDILARLDENIPPGVCALLLLLDFAHTDVAPAEWIDVFHKRTGMRYLHILDRLEMFDLKQQLLEDHPDALELVGYGPHLRWIERDPETGSPVYSPRWTDTKVRFRTVEDFGCKDWDWLLRYRDWAELFSLHPGFPKMQAPQIQQ